MSDAAGPSNAPELAQAQQGKKRKRTGKEREERKQAAIAAVRFFDYLTQSPADEYRLKRKRRKKKRKMLKSSKCWISIPKRPKQRLPREQEERKRQMG
jgi:hypothetical protein